MRCLVIALFLFTLFSPTSGVAGVHAGVAWVNEIDGVPSAAMALSWETGQTHPWEFMGGVIRTRQDRQLRTPRVLFASASKRFIWNRWFVQGGIAATSSDTDVLSAHWQFVTGAGYRQGHFTVSLRHLSNASTSGRNRGETLMLFQYGF